MNTVQLECFIEVSQTLNFSRAAQNLKMTQPAVSHQINSLEAELGTKLFNRTSKSVELTRNGIRFIGPANDALKILGTAKARISEKLETEVLPLGIVCRNIQMSTVLPPLLSAVAKELPACRPSVKISPFMPVYSVTENETADVIFSYKTEAPAQGRIVFRELMKCPICLICAENSELAQHDQITQAQLKGHSLALVSRQRSIDEIFRVTSAAAAQLHQNQIYLCETLDCALVLAEAGLCGCVAPRLGTQKGGGLKYIPITDAPPVSFGIYYSTLKANPVLKKFVEISCRELNPKR
mgnify:FL=1